MRGRGKLGIACGVVVVAVGVGGARVDGALELGVPFTDHAVLQAGVVMPVWGVTVPGAAVEVRLGERRRTTKAAADGAWQVEFAPTGASGVGVRLEVTSGREEITRNDLVFGEVWLASGQSNMRWMLKDCATGREAMASSHDAGLRLCNFAGRLDPGGTKFPREFLLGLHAGNYYESDGWQVASPQSTSGFSGVGYFFGRTLRDDLAVPVGIIHLAVGGSPMEAHLPRSAFRDDDLRPLLDEWWKNPRYPQWCRERAALNLTEWLRDPPGGRDPPHPFAPGFLWEAGVDPLLPFPVRGVIWYQGESNATVDGGRGAPVAKEVNRRKFEALIESWRRAWRDESLPVYFVQLPGLNRDWTLFREMQREVARDVSGTGMAVAIDLGHPTNVHPQRKKPVGERLAALALAGTYGKKVQAGGPQLVKVERRAGSIRLRFDRAVRAAGGGRVTGFAVAGADRVFHPATATASASGAVVEVTSPRVADPLAVRYAWANFPAGNLVDASGSPSGPFRSDEWPAGAEGEK